MRALSLLPVWSRFEGIERSFCLKVNRGCSVPRVRQVFTLVSRLGDGGFWYLLMLMLAVSGETTALVAFQMAVTGLLATVLYKAIKTRLSRERPYIVYEGIELGTAPLDRYSFPSGHTLHAVCFTVLATAYVPGLAVVLVPFSLLVAASRVVLGLHYPTDVVAGALIGASLALASLKAWPN